LTLPELVWDHRALAEEIIAHNCAVIVRRRAGGDWSAPENQYRNTLTELAELVRCKEAA
jgi:hypothetical protein